MFCCVVEYVAACCSAVGVVGFGGGVAGGVVVGVVGGRMCAGVVHGIVVGCSVLQWVAASCSVLP